MHTRGLRNTRKWEETLTKLFFAYDVILTRRRKDGINLMVDKLSKKCEENGLKINVDKFRLMTTGTEKRAESRGKEVKKKRILLT